MNDDDRVIVQCKNEVCGLTAKVRRALLEYKCPMCYTTIVNKADTQRPRKGRR